MKFRSVAVILVALLLSATSANADNWTNIKLCIHSGSDSAGAYTFTPVEDAADTLAIKLGSTTLAGFETRDFVAWGAADTTMYIYPVVISNGGAWPSGTDSIGVTVQGSLDATATTPTWTTLVPKTLLDMDTNVRWLPVTAKPWPWYRVLLAWGDHNTSGGPTQTMSCYVLMKR